MGQKCLVQWIGRFLVRDAKHMPPAILSLNETMVVDIPCLIFSDGRIINSLKLTDVDASSPHGLRSGQDAHGPLGCTYRMDDSVLVLLRARRRRGQVSGGCEEKAVFEGGLQAR